MAYDPLAINYKQQAAIFLDQLPAHSPHRPVLQSVSSCSDLLSTLSTWLATPSLTLAVETTFRPLLLDLCARWLQNEERSDDQFVAFCLLLETHPELYPVFSAFLRQPSFAQGPLAFVSNAPSIQSIDPAALHRFLLAYYRILQANRALPNALFWSLTPLSQLIWTPHPDAGVRFLAIRCYALQSGMMEAERLKLEKEVLGELAEVDCPIEYGMNLDGSKQIVDGWILPVIEAQRVVDLRNSHLEAQNYFTINEDDLLEPIHPADLSPLTMSIYGVLMLRSSVPQNNIESPLVPTSTAIESLRTLALHISLRVPTLLTSAASSGKSLLLSHLASTLHPDKKNQIITIHLADTSLDARSLLGSYTSSPTRPGTFEWKEGVLVRAMREGRWVVFEDIDRASAEVLGVIKPLIESLGSDKWVGGRASLDVPNRGRVEAEDRFLVFATRSISSRNGKFSSPTFFGAHKFHEIIIASSTLEDLCMIVDTKFPRLAGATGKALINLWEAVRAVGPAASTREIGMRELDKLCARIDSLLPESQQSMDVDVDFECQPGLPSLFPNPSLREDMYLEARDVLFGAGATNAAARNYLDTISAVVAEHLGLTLEKRNWILHNKTPEFEVEKDINGRTSAVHVGRTRLHARITKTEITAPSTRPFAMHRPAVALLSRIGAAVSLNEPVLLTGETGTGKTSVVTHLASLLRRPLISLNLSNQTESSDIIGGFKPVDARIPGLDLQERFMELFGGTFSRKKNAKFEESVRKAVQEGKWKRAIGLWRESGKLARERIRAKNIADKADPSHDGDSDTPRKRRKVDRPTLKVSEASWDEFERDIQVFEIQHVQGKGKFAFGFVEGPLVKALRSGHWILLDELNLASPETLECISSLLHGPTASITLTEEGSLEPVSRHPDFRLFACMNPATDVGKKDLPPNIRARFTEIDVPPPDADKETLLSIVAQYIGPSAVGDKAAIMDVAEFYSAVKRLAEDRLIADGSNHRPHFSMRTLTRALAFAADLASTYSLRRALFEGCLMAFTMILDSPSAEVVTQLVHKHILAGVRNPRSLLSKEPAPPQQKTTEEYVKLGPFYLERGPLDDNISVDDYIMTPSVERKLIDLARIIVTRRFPVLIEGPTSSGKTSSIEYLAQKTGHRFVRINNHEHTDIQEYLGSYVSDHITGKLVFKDGLLVRALRQGDWIVLDELNLAPTDVLEALNRLLDDNRELVIPETQEVVKPHPHFMLFATQNPSGLYAGRKVLSRAFRNRFLEVHFEDVPQAELETILCQRCRIAPSYGHRIVSVFHELQKRRQASRVFESKHGFATLRDLFRWAGRDAIDYQELADNGFMLLAERTRRSDDKAVVKEVIESVMKVRIDENRLYNLQNSQLDIETFLGCPIPSSSSVVWTSAMQRLFILVARALRFNEPVLLVGETGCGKTSVCQIYAKTVSKLLVAVNCHQNTETADLIGGLRPLRNRAALEAEVTRETVATLHQLGLATSDTDIESLISLVDGHARSCTLDPSQSQALQDVRVRLGHVLAMFEWHDGPLIQAMHEGNVFLLDEISLADDSVLERLNSVLEPGRTIILAERGGDDRELPLVKAQEDFKLVATMNPGGDYGKKELSPALRNRFTEIWVPAVDGREDLERIIESSWKHDTLRTYTGRVLDFVDWLGDAVADPSVTSLRDILAWVDFSNSICRPGSVNCMSENEIFHHAANMTFLDGLGSLPQLTAYSKVALEKLKSDAIIKLQELAPVANESSVHIAFDNSTNLIQLGTFALPKGPNEAVAHRFSLQAPTTRSNAMRVVRACQLTKPVLLEGSPGVGKTSLIAALAKIFGYTLCRINLSDQTDLVDLFGSDMPVEGGEPGQFAWKDAEFLRALQQGHWVLLDEMNLAPQAVLEGLNAVLDHRGTVYIPELGRSFTRHPAFRIFAAQNPLQQGGGRKGLPKSFLNRFTKVYVQELSAEDLLLVCRSLFPDYPVELLRGMITFASRLNEEVMTVRSFGREGAPWEFNLRDVIRWGTLLSNSQPNTHPATYLDTIFLQRFRTKTDREDARRLFDNVFRALIPQENVATQICISASYLQLGSFYISREGRCSERRVGRKLQANLAALESMGICSANCWLSIITGCHESGKTNLVRLFAHLTGNVLHEVCINHSTDAGDILGGFEQVDDHAIVSTMVDTVFAILDDSFCSATGSRLQAAIDFVAVKKSLNNRSETDALHALQTILEFLQHSHAPESWEPLLHEFKRRMKELSTAKHTSGRFRWVDGPLVRAVKDGHWMLLDGANLCNPSVLDRLNSLCETDGTLTLNERGSVDGEVEVIKPHPNFRLFMSVDPQHGELSRAMRNRGVEVALIDIPSLDDIEALYDHLRLPVMKSVDTILQVKSFSLDYERIRRGLSLQFYNAQSSWPVGRLASEDSVSSVLVDLAPVLRPSSIFSDLELQAASHFVLGNTAPAYLPYIARFLATQPNSYLQTVKTLLGRLTYAHFLQTVKTVREWVGRTCNIPPEFLSAQPIDLRYNAIASNSDLESSTDIVLRSLRLFVDLELHKTRLAAHLVADVPSARGREHTQISNTNDRSKQALEAVKSIAQAIMATGQAKLDTLSIHPGKAGSAKAELDLLLKLMAYVRFLAPNISSTAFNYSAVQVIAQWIMNVLGQYKHDFPQIENCAVALKTSVALTAGLGIADLWSSLASTTLSPVRSMEVVDLESLASRIYDNADALVLRSQIFELMALQALPNSPSEDEALTLVRLKQKIASLCTNPEISNSKQANALLLCVELAVVTRLNEDNEESQEDLAKIVQTIIQYTLRDVQLPLHRIVNYRHLMWLRGNDQKLTIDIVATLQLQWLEDIWRVSALRETNGPSIFFIPMQLHSTMQLCDWATTSLATLSSHEGSLQHHAQLLSTSLRPSFTRTMQLQTLLYHSVHTIISCFPDAFENNATTFEKSSANAQRVPQSSDDLRLLLSNIKNPSLNTAFYTHMWSLLERERNAVQTPKSILAELGHRWIGLSRVVLDLYVPDAPVDPAAIRRCAREFWEEERVRILAEIQMHFHFEGRAGKQQFNAATSYLQTLQADYENQLTNDSSPLPPSRNDIRQLHVYWSEVSQFLVHVISPGRIDGLVTSLMNAELAAPMREQVVQESVSAFSQRLSAVYADYEDINKPLRLALHYLKLGLRLILDSANRPEDDTYNHHATALVTFPTIRSIEILGEVPVTHDTTQSSFDWLLAKLAAIACEISLGVRVGTHLPLITTIYTQACGLWLIDRSREDDVEREGQTLYRQKQSELNPAREAELEEEDFLSMFPEFGDLLEEGDSDTQPLSKVSSLGKRSMLVDPSHVMKFSYLHHLLFTPPDSASLLSSQTFSFFLDTRRSIVGTLLNAQVQSMSEMLDAESHPYQVALLHDHISSLHPVQSKTTRYNFYTDENVPEIRKALVVLNPMQARLSALIEDWPDQMVLQHLKARCDAVLSLSLRSPVAKVLSALEQLLVQSEDWEMYANRENTLKLHQQALIGLIVEWRRLELSSWQDLLQTQADSFSDGASEWWFRLHESLIQGVISSVAEENDGVQDATANYFDRLIPLLDEFAARGPIGQFEARMRLLHDFESYMEHYLVGEVHSETVALQKTCRILHATRSYYGQFSPHICSTLSSQRAALEKEINGFIKLASWKDINVHALKQSAQRTHRQLYKSIRKFRDVLRQPVAAFFMPASVDTAEQIPLPAAFVDVHRPDHEFPTRASPLELSPHLVNLKRTFKTFDDLINGPIASFIGLHSHHPVNDLTSEIIAISQALSTSSIPSSLPLAQRQKLHKALLTRKRKAWSDLLKELKRIGLAANIKPEVLEQHRNQRWLREQPILTFVPNLPSIERVESYLNRLGTSLPELRALLSNHHPDLSTRELYRGIMFLESGFAMALDNRSCLAIAIGKYQQLKDVAQRMNMLAACPKIVASGSEVLQQVTGVRDCLAKLAHALEEILSVARIMQADDPSLVLFQPIMAEADPLVDILRTHSNRMEELTKVINLTHLTILLEGESNGLKEATDQLIVTDNLLRRWSQTASHLEHLLLPLRAWLDNHRFPELRRPTSHAFRNTDIVVDTLLVITQNLFGACSTSDGTKEPEDGDLFLRTDNRVTCNLTRLLRLNDVLVNLQEVLTLLPGQSEVDLATSTARIVPFVNRYVELVEKQMDSHSKWVMSLMKLDFVLCNVMRTVAKDGFCKPPDTEESKAGEEATNSADGGGLGEGTGTENVSKEIEDESQVEGLQGESGEDEGEVERAEEGDAIEMSEDFGGEMQDIPQDNDSSDEEQQDEDSPADLDEQLGDLDASDPSAIDEKLWGDESGPKDSDDAGGKSNQDNSHQEDKETEVVAKDGPQGHDKPKESEEDSKTGDDKGDIEDQEMETNSGEAEDDENQPGENGAPVDDYAQQADTLDLPDDMNLDNEQDASEPAAGEDVDMDDVDDDLSAEDGEGDQNDSSTPPPDDDASHENTEGAQAMEDIPPPEKYEENIEGAVAEPDVGRGDGSGGMSAEALSADDPPAVAGENPSGGQGGGNASDESMPAEDVPTPTAADQILGESEETQQPQNVGEATSGSGETRHGPAAQTAISQPSPNPLRSLGDALREISQRFDEILPGDPEQADPMEIAMNTSNASQLEYIHPDDVDEMQALGPAGDEEVAKLNDLHLVNDGPQTTDPLVTLNDKHEAETLSQPPNPIAVNMESTARALAEDVETALTRSDIASQLPNPSLQMPGTLPATQESSAELNQEDAEVILREWQAQGQPIQDAEHVWRVYESLTHDLSYALCEQLRLILEPTLATRLKGDYRTGKRLNMKKIIPYIASEYTKDKIWLRRTRASQREYQVLIALDDSRSMAESHSAHLAYQTLALVSKALGRLEVGDIAIAKFGETVDVLHGFDGGQFTDQAGTKVMSAFGFNQKATQVLSLVDTSLQLLERARERRSMTSASAADLWQLEIIISDGICQDHERLRTILRKAEEQRVMIVFIILDSLHTKGSSAVQGAAHQNSILSMNQVSYKPVDGRMELQVDRYLDTFPFEYYVVLRDVEALPEVLSGTLRQFFERISEE